MAHEHSTHMHGEQEKEGKGKFILYGISIVLFIGSFFPILKSYQVYLCLATVILAGYDLIIEGIKNIFHFSFEEDTLMTIAVIAAFILGEYPESCMVVLLFKLGEFLEEKAVYNSNKSIKKIVEIKAKTANLYLENGESKVIDVSRVKVGDMILIKPGEMIPVDAKVLEGSSSIDTSNITGESKPEEVQEKQEVLSGSINLTGTLICLVQKDVEHSTASQIVDLVYEATNNKGKTEAFITKFSKIYTPIVIVIACLVAILPPIWFGIMNSEVGLFGASFEIWKTWMMRALVFLVASCPCSIVISVPLAFFSCIGAISKKGMLIKGTKHIEDLSKATCIAFDKTGTITTGKMEIEELVAEGSMTVQDMLILMYNLEKHSNHPISTAIIRKVEREGFKQNLEVKKQEEIPGHGIYAEVEGKEILFGNEKLLKQFGVEEKLHRKNANYLVVDKMVQGYITLQEEVREGMNQIQDLFSTVGIEKTIMLTGDNPQNAEKIAKQIGMKEVYASLLPQDKLAKVKELKQEQKVIFVGDGINDSPVLAASDFGISMGEGTEIASNTADGILISNRIDTLPAILKIAQKCMKITKFNIIFSLIIKAIVLVFAFTGDAPMWLAIVADTGVSLLTVLNAVRIMRGSKN